MAQLDQQNLVINDDGSFVQDITDFSGGLNTRDFDTIIQANELSDVMNFKYDKRGSLTMRGGFTKLNNIEYGSSQCYSVGGYYKTGATREEIVVSGTTIGKRLEGGVTIADIGTGYTAGTYWDIHQFMDHLFMGDGGTNTFQVYDGSDIWDIGYIIPASGVTATEGAAGVLENKEYQYHVTYYYADGESNSNATPTAITPAANKKIELTNIPTGNSRVTQRKLYRTEGDGTTFKLLTTIEDNTTTSYSDNTPDSGLGADIDTDNTYSNLQNCKFNINHKSRMWYAGDPNNPSTLYYSKALHPESNPSTYTWAIGSQDGDVITGLAVNLGALIIFKKYSTWVITGDLPTGASADMVLEQVNPSIGCVGFKTIDHAGNDLLFMTPSNGVQRLHRIILAETESMDAEALSYKIEPTIDALNNDMLYKAHAAVWNNKYYLFVPHDTATECDRCLVLDLRDMNAEYENTIRWTQYDNMNFSCSHVMRDSEGESLHIGSTTEGYIYNGEDGVNDDGQAIEAYATTKYLEFGSFLNSKVPRLFAVSGRASEDYQFTIRQYMLVYNYATEQMEEQQETTIFRGGGAVSGDDVLWDDILWDDVLWDADGGYTNTVRDFIHTEYLRKPVHKLKLKIESVSANQQFAFYGWECQGIIGARKPLK